MNNGSKYTLAYKVDFIVVSGLMEVELVKFIRSEQRMLKLSGFVFIEERELEMKKYSAIGGNWRKMYEDALYVVCPKDGTTLTEAL